METVLILIPLLNVINWWSSSPQSYHNKRLPLYMDRRLILYQLFINQKIPEWSPFLWCDRCRNERLNWSLPKVIIKWSVQKRKRDAKLSENEHLRHACFLADIVKNVKQCYKVDFLKNVGMDCRIGFLTFWKFIKKNIKMNS